MGNVTRDTFGNTTVPKVDIGGAPERGEPQKYLVREARDADRRPKETSRPEPLVDRRKSPVRRKSPGPKEVPGPERSKNSPVVGMTKSSRRQESFNDREEAEIAKDSHMGKVLKAFRERDRGGRDGMLPRVGRSSSSRS